MGRRRRATGSGRLESWLGLWLAQGALVMLPGRPIGCPAALASPATVAEPGLAAGSGVPRLLGD
jgi:hypothetical protein